MSEDTTNQGSTDQTETQSPEETKRLRQRRKVARAVSTILELKNVNITAKEVLGMMGDDDVEDVGALAKEIAEKAKNDFRHAKKAPVSERRQAIETFMTNQWDSLKDNDAVLSALLHSYCMGRHGKDQRKEMKEELLARVSGQTQTDDSQSDDSQADGLNF